MERVSRLLGCLVAIVFVACSAATISPKQTGPTPDTPAPELCPTVCEHWRTLGCEEGGQVCDKYAEPQMTCSAWITCEAWCQQAETAKSQLLNLQCLATNPASTCKALEEACSY